MRLSFILFFNYCLFKPGEFSLSSLAGHGNKVVRIAKTLLDHGATITQNIQLNAHYLHQTPFDYLQI